MEITTIKSDITAKVEMIINEHDGKYELQCSDCSLRFKTYNEPNVGCTCERFYCFNPNLDVNRHWIKEEEFYNVQLECLKLHFPEMYKKVKDNLYFPEWYIKMKEKE